MFAKSRRTVSIFENGLLWSAWETAFCLWSLGRAFRKPALFVLHKRVGGISSKGSWMASAFFMSSFLIIDGWLGSTVSLTLWQNERQKHKKKSWDSVEVVMLRSESCFMWFPLWIYWLLVTRVKSYITVLMKGLYHRYPCTQIKHRLNFPFPFVSHPCPLSFLFVSWFVRYVLDLDGKKSVWDLVQFDWISGDLARWQRSELFNCHSRCSCNNFSADACLFSPAPTSHLVFRSIFLSVSREWENWGMKNYFSPRFQWTEYWFLILLRHC